MKTVLIAGGSGTIGKHLTKKLLEKGYEVKLLSRNKTKAEGITTYLWDVEEQYLEDEAIISSDYIINLAGANISEKRWTPKRKKEILDSRVRSNQLLLKSIQELKTKPKAYITASAVGYYGAITSEKTFTEDNSPSTDFLGTTCSRWESSCELAEELNIRIVKMRTGVVLNSGAGALSKMMLPIKMFMGSPLGNGKQYVPWIHIDDLCNIYIKAIEDQKMIGVFNAVAPEHVSNNEFTKSLAQILKKPILLPNVPSIIIKLVFGEMANIILEGSKVSSEKLLKSGYDFLYPNLVSALNQILREQK